MGNEDLLKQVTAKAQIWLGDGYDEETKAAVRAMLDNEDKTDLIEAFYKDLEFGTGGLRGIMGAGTNRMNIYTVGAATQGLSNYLKKAFADLPQIKVAIGHDCRNNSRKFAEVAADVVSANDMASNFFFQPAMILTTTYSITLHLCRALYIFCSKVMVILWIKIFAKRNSCTLAV